MRERVQPLPVESRPLVSLAGAVLAQSVRSERDQPPFDRVTMDGIAFASQAWRAGPAPLPHRRHPGRRPAAAAHSPTPPTCIEAMTGAVLPRGCDCVVPVERLHVEDGVAQRRRRRAGRALPERAHARPRRARGRPAARARHAPRRAGTRRARLGRAATSRRAHANPRILIATTGDELVAPDEPIAAWQVRRSNSYALRGALNLRGIRAWPRITCPTTTRCSRATGRAPRDARRDRADGRRVDGPVRPRAERAAAARRAGSVPQGRAAPRQADVVRHRPGRPDRVRAARQPGLGAGLPAALRRAGARRDARRAGPRRGARRRSARPSRSSRHWRTSCRCRWSTARRSAWSPCRGRRAARAISFRCSARTASSNCRRAPRVSGG